MFWSYAAAVALRYVKGAGTDIRSSKSIWRIFTWPKAKDQSICNNLQMKRLFLLLTRAFKFTGIAYWLLYLAVMNTVALTHPLNELNCSIRDSRDSWLGVPDPLTLPIQCTSRIQYVFTAIIYGLPFTIGIWLSLSLLVSIIVVIFALLTYKSSCRVEN